jgi:hypothetical protein
MRRAQRAVVVLALAAATTAFPSAVFADDGQVLNSGSNIAGNVFINGGGHAQINFQNVNNCPGGMPNTSCWVEIQFQWHCAEPWCFGWGESQWYIVPSGQDWFADFGCQDGANEWRVRTQLHFVTPNATTMQVRGDLEAEVGGYVMVPRYFFNVGARAGFQGGALLNTVTAANYTTGQAYLGASQGNITGPSHC